MQRDRILGYLERGRAEVPGRENGFSVQPAHLCGSPDNVCSREEVFCPVAYLIKFRDADEAVSRVNRSDYGLANSVWSADPERATQVAHRLDVGNAWINAHNLLPHGVAYGGVNLSGLGGGVLGPETLADYLRPMCVLRPL